MSLAELFILAVGLSMDAFAVSVCKGLSLGKIKPRHMCLTGLWFGGFQALMPLVGYFAGRFFADMDRLFPVGDHRRQYDKRSLWRRGNAGLFHETQGYAASCGGHQH